MRPSKLRLPERTAATTRSRLSTALAIDSGSGPLLPMQVVQPYPTVLKPSWSRYLRQSRLVQIIGHHAAAGGQRCLHVGRNVQSLARRPSWPASPAAIITEGLLVLVQLVMAAMATSPWVSLTHLVVDADAGGVAVDVIIDDARVVVGVTGVLILVMRWMRPALRLTSGRGEASRSGRPPS